jgi:DnaK suppressor protein
VIGAGTDYPVAVPDTTIDPTLRAALTDERDRLVAQIASLEPGHGGSPDFDDNFADSGQVAAEQGENKVLAQQFRTELEEIERALAKIEDGTYGSCEKCGEPIPPARLEAVPTARFCIAHA